MQRRQVPALIALLAASRRGAAQSTPSVVVSFSILGDFVRQLVGDRLAVRVLAGPDTDAHDFQPRPSDAAAVRAAGLLVQNGLGFDPWFERLARVGGANVPRVRTTDGLTPLGMVADTHPHDATERRRGHMVGARRVADPHAWQDVRRAKHYVARIAEGLTRAWPALVESWALAASGYQARLDALDLWVRAEIATVPEARRRVITAHDAFGYFGAAYGVRFLAPQGVSTAAEPAPAEVGRLIRQIRAEGITAVLLENTSNAAVLTRLAQEAGVRVSGRLYADALSTPDGPAATYEAMIRHNVGLLVPAMRGQA